MSVVAGSPLVEQEKKIASKETIRKFVKDLADLTSVIKDARDDRNEVIASNEDIQRIDEQMKQLREERKDLIAGSTVIQGYEEKLQDAVEERRQLIADAKQDGVPRGEIDEAIRMLKKHIDPSIAAEVYGNIADLVD